jgi:hypothetical protein
VLQHKQATKVLCLPSAPTLPVLCTHSPLPSPALPSPPPQTPPRARRLNLHPCRLHLFQARPLHRQAQAPAQHPLPAPAQ